VALLLMVACGFLVLEPWHGPTVLALSEQHGVDAADLPALPLIALALALAGSRARGGSAWQRRRPGGRMASASAVVLGSLLVAGIADPRIGSPLVPAGGGTLDGDTQHVNGRRSEPVGRWTHLALTYDGARYRLYIDGAEASSRSASGRVLRTSDPLWIGGNRPYGEYFRGVIDEVRVYDRALDPAQVRAAMSTPLGAHDSHAPGLRAAYAFDAGRGETVDDDSGNGNAGTIRGANWTSAGRFGGAIGFDSDGAVVRVPASASLDLKFAMTLTAWIEPSRSQPGWRTVLARQTDSYFLAAGGGRELAGSLEALDRWRFALVLLLVGATGFVLARGHAPWAADRGRWYWPVALFVAASLVDVALAPSDTLNGPALIALWCAATSSQRGERVCMYALSGLFATVTVLSIADPAALPLPRDAGGVIRSAALGLLLVGASVSPARRCRSAGCGPRA
jgi:hypothetical protein